jgi:acylphosphatase
MSAAREDDERREANPSARATMFVRGRVQGVGFRWWTRARALELGLVGHARNMADGRVEVVAEGPESRLDALAQLLREQPSTSRRPGHVDSVVVQRQSPRGGISGFLER